MPPILPPEGVFIAQGFPVTASSFALHINQWSFLAADLWADKPTGF